LKKYDLKLKQKNPTKKYSFTWQMAFFMITWKNVAFQLKQKNPAKK
jgi:hypothetical protein